MLSETDTPDNMELLHRPGTVGGERDLQANDFSSDFNLPQT